MKKIKNMMAVLVLYNRTLNESITFKSLSDALMSIDSEMDLFIYDNSPVPMVDQSNHKYKNWNIFYINDKSNSGVSKAYNEGYKLAKKLGKEWLLLLDQDSFFQKDIFHKYIHAINNNRDIHLFAPLLISKGSICSPCSYILKKGKQRNKIEFGILNLKKKSVLNSGMLIRVSIFGKIGGYKETVWLDYSDHVFIEKYKKYYSSVYIIDTKVYHGHSSIDNTNFKSSLTRFAIYCESISNASENKLERMNYAIIVLLRAIKLFIKYKKKEFIKVYLKVFLLKKS